MTQFIILHTVADHFGITIADLKSTVRKHTHARRVAFYILNQKLKLTLKEISVLFAYKDQTATGDGVRHFKDSLNDQDLQAVLARLDIGEIKRKRAGNTGPRPKKEEPVKELGFKRPAAVYTNPQWGKMYGVGRY